MMATSDNLRMPDAAEVGRTVDTIVEGLLAGQVGAEREAAALFVERRLRGRDARVAQAIASALRAGVHRWPAR